MKINYQILCVFLILSLGFVLMNKKDGVSSADAVMENIFSRTSIRSFTGEKVSDETLTELVKAGMAAPTAGNMQPWKFVAVNDPELLKQLGNMHEFSTPAAVAPAAIVVLADMDIYKDRPRFEKFWITDTSAATENILLAANAMGLGAVWLSVYPFDEREVKVRQILNIPSSMKVLCMVAVGHATNDIAPKDKWKPENLYFNSVGK